MQWSDGTGPGGGQIHPAVYLTWGEVAGILGRPHQGTAEDDQRLVEALLAAGAPTWVEKAPGWIDERGWGLYRPQPLGFAADGCRRPGGEAQ
jgi:hypothetical protein